MSVQHGEAYLSYLFKDTFKTVAPITWWKVASETLPASRVKRALDAGKNQVEMLNNIYVDRVVADLYRRHSITHTPAVLTHIILGMIDDLGLFR